ncbi:MAG: hypothetical protein MUE85_13155 [Microscillaceae bacterium]|jgi:hypothetical protein|nr:hypothetical protein [Microscillaceae bacterium]
MKTSDIIKIVAVVLLIGFTWKFVVGLIGKIIFWGLIAGGVYVGFKALTSDNKQIER